MRDLDTIDSELRLLVAVHRVTAERGAKPSIWPVDKLLDERLAQNMSPVLWVNDPPAV